MFLRNRLVFFRKSKFSSLYECSNKLSILSILNNNYYVNKRKLINPLSLIKYSNYSISFILNNNYNNNENRIRIENINSKNIDNYSGPLIENNVIDINFVKDMINHFYKYKLLPKEYVISMLKASIKQHRLLSTLLRLNIPNNGNFNICGDTHGQFRDFCEILTDGIGSFPSNSNIYLFNGDFVDRGSQSFEIIMTLLSFKLANPYCMYLLRGNHETTSMNQHYGFEKEILKKYDREVLTLFRELFMCLPLAAVVENEVFITHGGIGPLTAKMTLDEIDDIDRMQHEDASNDSMTALHELLWSDPGNHNGFKRSGRGGDALTFGNDVTDYFINNNNLSFIVRSHECRNNGWSEHHGGKCITIFSAPNYCGTQGNLGAFLRLAYKEINNVTIQNSNNSNINDSNDTNNDNANNHNNQSNKRLSATIHQFQHASAKKNNNL